MKNMKIKGISRCHLILGVIILAIVFLTSIKFVGKEIELQSVSSFANHDTQAEQIYSENTSSISITPEDNFIPTFENARTLTTMEDLQKYLYSIDENAYVTEQDLNIDKLLSHDLKTDLQSQEPKILIFHTHSQEDFIDSRPGVVEDTIVGVGSELADILANDYGIPVVHDTGQYDFVDGKENREESYQNMEPAVQSLMEKYPSVEIAIDLHRDGVPDDVKFVTDINGKPTAKLMFFNGITKINNNGQPEEIEDLVNPFLEENLSLSLQMKLTANEMYPDLTRKIYIKPYRYSLHLLPKSMLVEVGANTSTVEEAKNAMYPLAEILVEVLDSK